MSFCLSFSAFSFPYYEGVWFRIPIPSVKNPLPVICTLHNSISDPSDFIVNYTNLFKKRDKTAVYKPRYMRGKILRTYGTYGSGTLIRKSVACICKIYKFDTHFFVDNREISNFAVKHVRFSTIFVGTYEGTIFSSPRGWFQCGMKSAAGRPQIFRKSRYPVTDLKK